MNLEGLVVIERRRSAPTPILGRQFGVEVLWSGPDAFFGLLQDDSRNFERRSKLHFLIVRTAGPPPLGTSLVDFADIYGLFSTFVARRRSHFVRRESARQVSPFSVSLTASGDAPRSRTSIECLSPRTPSLFTASSDASTVRLSSVNRASPGLGMTRPQYASRSNPTGELQHELSINCSGDASTVRLSSRGRLHHEQSINWNEQSFLCIRLKAVQAASNTHHYTRCFRCTGELLMNCYRRRASSAPLAPPLAPKNIFTS